jgi:eukaryotic-like serine/threonine-protein kinase
MADRSGEHFGTYRQVRSLGQDEVPFLVMDYAQDGSLRKLHPKGIPLPLAQVVTSVKQVADALQYAHEQKFIYHDVKPEDFTIQVKKREFSQAEK